MKMTDPNHPSVSPANASINLSNFSSPQSASNENNELIPFVSISTFQSLPSPLPLDTETEGFLPNTSLQLKRAFTLNDLTHQTDPLDFCLNFKSWVLLEEYTKTTLQATPPTLEQKETLFKLWYYRFLAWIYLRLASLAILEAEKLPLHLNLCLSSLHARMYACIGQPLLALSLLSKLHSIHPSYIDQQRLAVAVAMNDARLVKQIGKHLESHAPIAVALAYLAIGDVNEARRVNGEDPWISHLLTLLSYDRTPPVAPNPSPSNALLSQLYNGLNVHALKDHYADHVASSSYSEIALLNYTCLLELTHSQPKEMKINLLKEWMRFSDVVDPYCVRLTTSS